MAQHLPIQAKHHCQLETTHQVKNNSVSAWPGPPAARRNCSRPPGGIHAPPGASASHSSSLTRVRLADLVSPPGASLCRPPEWVSHRLAHPIQPPGAVTVQYHSLISPLFQSNSHFSNPSKVTTQTR